MRTFTTADPITVDVRNPVGEIVVELTDTTTTTVEVVPAAGSVWGRWDEMIGDLFRSLSRGSWDAPDGDRDSGGQALDLVRTEYQDVRGTLLVDTDQAHRSSGASFTVRITAPTASALKIRSDRAPVRFTGSSSRVEVKSSSGAVDLDTVTGPVVVQTSSGSVRVRSAGAGAELRTASGSVDLEDVHERAQVHSTSGDVVIGHAHADLAVRSVSGDVRVTSCRTGTADITSVSGSVWVGVGPAVTAHLDLTTLTGRAETSFDVLDHDPYAATPSSRHGSEQDADAAPADSEDAGSADPVQAGPDPSSAEQEAHDDAEVADPAGVESDALPDPVSPARLTLSVTTTSGAIRVHPA